MNFRDDSPFSPPSSLALISLTFVVPEQEQLEQAERHRQPFGRVLPRKACPVIGGQVGHRFHD